MSWLILATGILLAVGLAAWWGFGRPPPPRYVAAEAAVGPVTRNITASGTVNPQLTVLVGAYVSGTIQDISCDFNTRVRRGQICARIDPRPYQTVVDQDAAALATARAQLVKDEAALAYARSVYGRYAALLSQDSIARQSVDEARSAVDQAAAQVGLDRANVKQHQASLDAALVNLGYTRITSPVDGTVVSRNVTQGQTVAASFQTPTLFLIATDLARMQVDANVSESDIGGDLRAGDRATFTVDAFPQRTFHAVVTQIRQSPQTVQNVITYDVVLTVDNSDLALKPGMTATSKIILAERHNVLRVPNQALRYRPGGIARRGQSGSTDRAGGAGVERQAPRVFVLRDGKPTRVAVATGLADEAFTEIVGGALRAGDRVITSEGGGAGEAPYQRPITARF
ncbi:MAG: efflux RND transporter periplasmic adaptor subunit [Caulobacteraceae bacterium]|nr:efflux RND transporter periplasmic adaptor subunit [Caulobacteraceae bacterium]